MNIEHKFIKLKIVSDGTQDGTFIIDEEGNKVAGVQKVVIMMDSKQISAAIQIMNIPVEWGGKMEIISTPILFTPGTSEPKL